MSVTTGVVLVTGAAGFVGRHLLGALGTAKPDWIVHAWGHGSDHEIGPAAQRSLIDLEDGAQLKQAVSAARPDFVVHLAAASNVAGSFEHPQRTWVVNVMGWLNLLEAVRGEAPEARILFVSSSEVYGESFKAGIPLDEGAPLKPMNPYAASKAAAEILAQTYVRQGLRIITARPFNHIGPGQGERFAIASFAAQIARIEAGLQEPQIQVGNLDAKRDFHDVRDTVGVYVAALERFDALPAGFAFNLCAGKPRRIGDVLKELLALSRESIEVVTDAARLRPSDIPLALGDCSEARDRLGWNRRIPWERTLRDILNDWRGRIGRE